MRPELGDELVLGQVNWCPEREVCLNGHWHVCKMYLKSIKQNWTPRIAKEWKTEWEYLQWIYQCNKMTDRQIHLPTIRNCSCSRQQSQTWHTIVLINTLYLWLYIYIYLHASEATCYTVGWLNTKIAVFKSKAKQPRVKSSQSHPTSFDIQNVDVV